MGSHKAYRATTGKQLEVRDWEIFKDKTEQISSQDMYCPEGRLLMAFLHDEHADYGDAKIQDRRPRVNGVRKFFNTIQMEDAKSLMQSSYSDIAESRGLSRSINAVSSNISSGQKNSSRYPAFVGALEIPYDGFAGFEGIGRRVRDAAKSAGNFMEFEELLLKKLS